MVPKASLLRTDLPQTKQDSQCKYNVILKLVGATIFVMGKQ